MMRYQSMSQQQDCLSFADIRRPNSLKLINEEDQRSTTSTTTNQSYSNGDKGPTFEAFGNRAHRIRPGPNPSTAQDRTFPSPPPPPATHQHDAAGNAPLQWGHKKRTRVPRTELGRSAACDDPPAAAAGRRPAKAPRLPPPPGGTHHRGVSLRSSSASNPNRTVDERSNGRSSPPLHAEKTQRAATRAGNGGADAANPPSSSEAVAELPKIHLTLSRKEKEEDFLLMKGTKLTQRPKKRLKAVEKALQYIYPGMWLSDLSRGRYEVREKKCAKKKRRGLKGMESVDSDSY